MKSLNRKGIVIETFKKDSTDIEEYIRESKFLLKFEE
jgi:hypothetical protein